MDNICNIGGLDGKLSQDNIQLQMNMKRWWCLSMFEILLGPKPCDMHVRKEKMNKKATS